MNGLSLFSGIGGIDVALSDWVKTKAYCEIDPFCQSILLSRMQEKKLSKAPIWNDIRKLPYEQLPKIEIIFGGFPCQDLSIAGHGKGLAGERSGLFFEILRLAQEIKPPFIFLENVPAITARGGLQVIESLAAIGYDCRWIVKSCKEIGLSHARERWFCLAYAKSQRLQEIGFTLRKKKKQPRSHGNAKHEIQYERAESPHPFYRVDDDLSGRVDRVKALGNAVCIEQTKSAFKELLKL